MNMMSKRKAARRRALRAVQAVSIGGVAFVAPGCGSEAGSADGDDDVTTLDGAVTPDAELDIPESDILVDTAEDVAADVEPDVQADAAEDTERDSTEPDVVPDVAQDVMVEVGEDTTPEDVRPDAPEDVAQDADVEADTTEDVADTSSDVTDGGDSCEPEEDNLCPDNCTQDNDWDCCQRFIDETGLPCFFDPGVGCSCAAVGPFNPPAFRGQGAKRSA